MKYINQKRTDEDCLNNCIRMCAGDKKEIKATKKLSIENIRYIDNQYRIYEARRNWKRIIEDVIDLLI